MLHAMYTDAVAAEKARFESDTGMMLWVLSSQIRMVCIAAVVLLASRELIVDLSTDSLEHKLGGAAGQQQDGCGAEQICSGCLDPG